MAHKKGRQTFSSQPLQFMIHEPHDTRSSELLLLGFIITLYYMVYSVLKCICSFFILMLFDMQKQSR